MRLMIAITAALMLGQFLIVVIVPLIIIWVTIQLYRCM